MWELDTDEWDKMMAMNLKTSFLISKYFSGHKGIKKIMLILQGTRGRTPAELYLHHGKKLGHKSTG